MNLQHSPARVISNPALTPVPRSDLRQPFNIGVIVSILLLNKHRSVGYPPVVVLSGCFGPLCETPLDSLHTLLVWVFLSEVCFAYFSLGLFSMPIPGAGCPPLRESLLGRLVALLEGAPRHQPRLQAFVPWLVTFVEKFRHV